VDQDGDVIDILVQPRRDHRAAEKFFHRLLRGRGQQPMCVVTDRLRSYSAVMRAILCNVVIAWNGMPTIAPKLRINRPGKGSGKCVVSNPSVRPSDFFPSTVLSRTCSA
jgi:transposase-like protein